MSTTRRGFLQAILAAGVAPYVQTTAGVLMPVRNLALPERYGVNPLQKITWELQEHMQDVERMLMYGRPRLVHAGMLYIAQGNVLNAFTLATLPPGTPLE